MSFSDFKAGVKSFAEKPYIGLAGVIVSSVALVLSILFWYLTYSRMLVCFIVSDSSQKIVGIEAFKIGELSIKYKNRDLDSPVFSKTLRIWNAGNIPVYRDNILDIISKPQKESIENKFLIIKAKPQIEILKIDKVIASNGTNFYVEDSKVAIGKIFIKWDILRPGDSAILEVIYKGEDNVSFSLIGELSKKKAIKNISGFIKLNYKSLSIKYISLFVMALAFIALLIAFVRRKRLFETQLETMEEIERGFHKVHNPSLSMILKRVKILKLEFFYPYLILLVLSVCIFIFSYYLQLSIPPFKN